MCKKQTSDQTLDWMLANILSNKERAKLQQVKKTYSKNGFNINFLDMMLGLLDKMLAKPEIVSHLMIILI